jgi:uracil-DNA glycosylase family 4
MKNKKLLLRLENSVMLCNKCTRLRSVTPIPYPHIYYNTLEELDIMIIGRNAGLEHEYENISKEDFLGKYEDNWWICNIGKYIRNVIGDDYVRNRVFFTNICKCSSPNNSKLKQDELSNCIHYLIYQIKIVKPRYIIVLGREAKECIADNFNISDIEVGYFYHPSYFSYAGNIELEKKQYNKIRKFLRL